MLILGCSMTENAELDRVRLAATGNQVWCTVLPPLSYIGPHRLWLNWWLRPMVTTIG